MSRRYTSSLILTVFDQREHIRTNFYCFNGYALLFGEQLLLNKKNFLASLTCNSALELAVLLQANAPVVIGKELNFLKLVRFVVELFSHHYLHQLALDIDFTSDFSQYNTLLDELQILGNIDGSFHSYSRIITFIARLLASLTCTRNRQIGNTEQTKDYYDYVLTFISVFAVAVGCSLPFGSPLRVVQTYRSFNCCRHHSKGVHRKRIVHSLHISVFLVLFEKDRNDFF